MRAFFIVFLCCLCHLSYGQAFNRNLSLRGNSTVSIGSGLGVMAGDNTGGIRRNITNFLPAVSLSYARQLNSTLDLRATVGGQVIGSKHAIVYENFFPNWIENGYALSFTGRTYFADIMPVVYLFSNSPYEAIRSDINVYAGAGFGYLTVFRSQNMVGETTREDVQTSTPYIPLRLGVSRQLSPFWNLSLEGSAFITFSDYLDGNAGTNTRNDHFIQAQLMLTRYLSRYR
ncbi:hypothetical protein KI659_04690 [Litoribacter alkaliphilus]|uniref:Outer membrane beta-barrel protein n=1 Tax=Litoribacter ruber TaxID=702568 RepID=A0AAP2G3B3_9BACT|nr:DUF6089 family protein [Litoribacter alkaliphilus]MBS9523310.1 hypothetical protein [Litoribacter alkaliphilus]